MEHLPPGGHDDRLPLPIDRSLFFKLVRVVNLTARPFVETLSHAHELTLDEWRTMVVLAGHPGATVRKVSDLTGMDRTTVGRAADSLERQSRLRRDVDPGEARRGQLRLTDAGGSLFRSLGVLAAEREQQLFSGLSAADRLQFEHALDQLIASLGLPDPSPDTEL